MQEVSFTFQTLIMKTIIFFILILADMVAAAQWSSNTAVNNAICNYTGNQTIVQVASDGAGGAICTWVDTRNGTQDIYAQRIDLNGTLQWNVDGIAICNAVSDQYFPRLVSDAAGGAIIAWYDNRAGNYDIYAQRINSSGVVQWTTDGVAITTQPGNQNAHQIITDGSGGAIIVWSDGAGGGPNADIKAQRIDASGTVLWPVSGASVCNASSLQNTPQLISDGNGGAIISWEDWRSFSQPDIYAQRISSNGFTNWTFNGVLICSEPNLANQYSTKIVSDGAGGAIICWLDQRNFGSGQDIYAQRVNASGLVQWVNNGIAVCNANALQTAQQMISDGAGGAIIIWEDRRTERDIYAQRLNNTGTVQWIANGISVCNATGTQTDPQLVSRVSGGATIVWTDLRNSSQADIYAQAITLNGLELWISNGVPVANETHSQSVPQLIPDAADGAIIAWMDLRTTIDYDIYSSRLAANGTLPVKLISFSANLQNKNAVLHWQTADELNLAKYNVQRSLDGNTFSTIGTVIPTGNSTANKNYSYPDFNIIALNTSLVYYRLQMQDIDGKTAYSKIEMVKPVSEPVINITPNPASDYLHIYFPSKIKTLHIISTTGQIIKVISLSGLTNQQKIDIREIPAGNYFMKAVGEKQVWTKQFIKQY